ncbi:DUF7552 domain-containing protein [Haloarchaeobius sp. TZWWS8]|uniref:DUF7552 domain-containing protein n=1 Tax=Haloarchaeobius sp. TZWWS8 TaxID=3446121 RepID=UPI003EBE23FC
MMVGKRDGFGSIREHLDALDAPGGPYYLVCAKSGTTPAPAEGLRFDARATAAEAADVVASYRAYLRLYDPSVPICDLIVCEETDGSVDAAGAQAVPGGSNAEP